MEEPHSHPVDVIMTPRPLVMETPHTLHERDHKPSTLSATRTPTITKALTTETPLHCMCWQFSPLVAQRKE